MQRPIKFRAGYDGGIYEVTEIMWSDGTAYIVELDNEENGETIGLDQITLLQFTGFKDKHGVEVYEGDVLEWLDRKAVVSFKDGEFIAKWDKDASAFNERLRVHSGFIVTGNIYENPELLTV